MVAQSYTHMILACLFSIVMVCSIRGADGCKSSSSSGVTSQLRCHIASSAIQGKRHAMEDFVRIQHNFMGQPEKHFVGIYDGHDGEKVAFYAYKQLHKHLATALKSKNPDDEQTIKECLTNAITSFDEHDTIRENDRSGSCVIACCVLGNTIYTINVGDSRAVLCTNGHAVDLSIDHKPNRPDELERIQQAGGVVVYTGGWKRPEDSTYNVCKRFTWNKDSPALLEQQKRKSPSLLFLDIWRIGGFGAMSRTIGDHDAKQCIQGLIATPEISTHQVGTNDEFIILASDGVWDVIESQQAVDIVKAALGTPPNPEAAARRLQNEAFNNGSGDNISVIVVVFEHSEPIFSTDCSSITISDRIFTQEEVDAFFS